MNVIRCERCGADLSISDGPITMLPACPRCGHRAIDSSATVITRNGDVAATQASVFKEAEKDTDANAAAILRTVAFGESTAKVTGGADSHDGRELYDFLTPPQQPDEIGRLGTYRVLRVLGHGGMGVVYEAEDPALQRRVALKAMLPTLAVSASARQRFVREARAAAMVEHERIVPIFQVGEDGGIPFLVMPLLKGETLEERVTREGRLPLAESIRIGREIAEALAVAHERGLIHRDIKPGNVWLEASRGGVKLLDFGLARAAESDTPLTQQGSIVGTPAFMAPEQANGASVDARCDLFSLGCVLYRCCTGELPFQGVSAVTILIAIVGKQPTAPKEIAPDVPAALSQLILDLLAKDPAQRPATAQAVIKLLEGVQSAPDAARPPAAAPPPPPEKPGVAASPPVGSRSGRWKIALVIALAALLGAAALIVPPLIRPAPAAGPVEIGVAFGSEKTGWFTEAVADFAAAPEGKDIKVTLISMGSLEGGRAVAKDGDQRINVWAPASSLYKATVLHEWQAKHPGKNPILKEESLCSTPMVFVFWKDRHDAFIAKFKAPSFKTIAEAMQAKQGWGEITGKPEWGRFRFGHTNPEQSNSGLATLVLMACEFFPDRAATPADLADSTFQAQVASNKRGLAGMSNSTGNLMKDMVVKGPSAYDAVFVYENLAIDYLKSAQGRWGDLHVAYPPRNIWSDHPYCILDVPWSSKEQRQAAETFLAFLMSEPQQRKALAHGFRPANINIPIRDHADSPFVKHKDRGLQINVAANCDFGGREAVEELLAIWRRAK
jgi:hypothetical protein